MKNSIKRIFSCFIAVLLFVSCPISVYAEDVPGWEGSLGLQLYYNKDKILQYIKDTGQFWLYGASQMGAIVKGDFVSYAENYKKMDDILATGKDIGVYVNESDEMKGLYFSKDFMSQLKALLDDYAKENEPYYIGKTYAFDTADFSELSGYRNVYNTIKNLLNESKSGFVVCAYNYDGSIWYADIDKNFADLSFVKVRGNDRLIGIYDNETWKRLDWTVYYVKLSPDDEEIKTAADFKKKATQTFSGNRWDYALTQETRVLLPLDTTLLTRDSINIYSWPYLVSKETRRVRVFKEFADFQDYTLNKRKVYYTSNYYNYVPEDLTVSIDDLEKEIDDLSKVIDQLLDQISKDTDESEIEELLKQILEELRNGGGSGGGGSGGDVNVDIDLSTTNGLLSKTLAKVTQIFDKISETAGGAVDTVNTKLQETLDEMLAQLKEISGDVSDIKGQLENMSEQEFDDKSDSFLGEIMDAFSEISEVVKTKFPFSIPNDLRIFLSKIAPAAPETGEQQLESYSLDSSSGMTLYSGEHGGGGSSDGETNPPGGGGSSRPGSGFVDVEHGGGGGTREPVEMREAPVFCLPIVIERYGIEEYIIIDMSPFDPLSRFSRSFFTIIFMVCLFNLTFKVIGMWGDLIG